MRGEAPLFVDSGSEEQHLQRVSLVRHGSPGSARWSRDPRLCPERADFTKHVSRVSPSPSKCQGRRPDGKPDSLPDKHVCSGRPGQCPRHSLQLRRRGWRLLDPGRRPPCRIPDPLQPSGSNAATALPPQRGQTSRPVPPVGAQLHPPGSNAAAVAWTDTGAHQGPPCTRLAPASHGRPPRPFDSARPGSKARSVRTGALRRPAANGGSERSLEGRFPRLRPAAEGQRRVGGWGGWPVHGAGPFKFQPAFGRAGRLMEAALGAAG